MRRATSVMALVIAACTATEGPPTVGPVARVSVAAGDSQIGTVHAELPTAILVRVLDSGSRAVPGQFVAFRVVQGGGSVFAGGALSNSAGEVRERWMLGDTAGMQILEARAVDQTTGEPITYARLVARAQPGPLAVHGFTASTIRVTAETPIILPIRATDAWGNRVAAPAPVALDTAGALAFQADSLWHFSPAGPGRFRFMVGTETCSVRVHVPLGTFEYVAHRGDTTDRLTGQLIFTAWALGLDPHTKALYEVLNVMRVRRVGADSVIGPASPINRFEHTVRADGAPARAVFINNPLTPSRGYLWFMSSSASAWVFAVGREVLDTDTAWVRR